jgi:uncharacterized protein
MADRSVWRRTDPLTGDYFKAIVIASPLLARLNAGMHRLRSLAFIILGLIALAGSVSAADQGVVEIASKTGVHAFAVEMAVNDAERAKGLMYRKELPEGQGMLFDFQREQETSFWMENTYISLDIIFIRADGRILRIAENTEPLSQKLIPSGGPVRGVLEVIAGTARKLGIAPGDRVAHPIFGAR